MTTARDTIVDALDIESFVLCESEKEAKDLVGKLMQSLIAFPREHVIVSLDFNGPGAHSPRPRLLYGTNPVTTVFIPGSRNENS